MDNFEILMAAALTFPELEVHALVSASKGESDISIPRSWREVMRNPDLWMPPMQKEIETLTHKGVWQLEKPPPGTQVIDGMWVYDIKVDGNSKFLKPKACWVACGDRMQCNIDYGETWAMVARMESVHIVMAIAVIKGLATQQWDFSGAYLNGDQDQPVWMQQLLGFVKPGEEHMACQLLKALYGTPNVGHIWYKTLRKEIEDFTNQKPIHVCAYKRWTHHTQLQQHIQMKSLQDHHQRKTLNQ
jgi:hypothetical protein